MSLPDSLERAAGALPELGDGIRPANGDPTRLREGLDPDAAAQVLTWLLVEEPEAGAELALAWAEDPEGAGLLACVDEAALGRPGRKALRRALHVARSRGHVRERPAAPQRVATLPQLEDELTGAYVSPLDPSGARVALLIEPHPAGGARVFEVLLDEARGILECEAFNASRGNARRFQRSLTRRDRAAATPASPDAVRALVARAASRQPTDRPLPAAFVEWRSRVAEAPAGTRTPGQEAREALGAGSGSRAEALEAAVGLVRSGTVGPWPPDEEALRQEAARLDEARRSRVVVSDARREERLAELIAEAAARVFDAEHRARSAERFEEMAYVLWKSEREPEARACLAAAASFGEADAERGPIARAMLEKLLGPLIEKLRSEEEEESMLVRP